MKPYEIKSDKLDHTIYKVTHDVNGNPRFVVHYLAVPFEWEGAADAPFWVKQEAHIEHAKRVLYGNRYRAKWFGGGIVFSTYADPVDYVLAAIEEAGV